MTRAPRGGRTSPRAAKRRRGAAAASGAAAAEARLVHAIPGRARLRVPARRGDDAWFEGAARTLADAPGLEELRVNTTTASILLAHGGALDALLGFAEERALFRVAPTEAGEAARQPRLDPRLGRLLRGELDAASTAALVLAALGTLQVARGQVLPAGVTMLTEAFKLIFGSGAGGVPLDGDGE